MGHSYEISLLRADTLITPDIWSALLRLVLRLNWTFQSLQRVPHFTVKHSLERRGLDKDILSEHSRASLSLCITLLFNEWVVKWNSGKVFFSALWLRVFWQVTCQNDPSIDRPQRSKCQKQDCSGKHTRSLERTHFLKSSFLEGLRLCSSQTWGDPTPRCRVDFLYYGSFLSSYSNDVWWYNANEKKIQLLLVDIFHIIFSFWLIRKSGEGLGI